MSDGYRDDDDLVEGHKQVVYKCHSCGYEGDCGVNHDDHMHCTKCGSDNVTEID